MRILVLGGTIYVSKAIAALAGERGHDVTVVARGRSGSPPDGVRFVPADFRRFAALARRMAPRVMASAVAPRSTPSGSEVGSTGLNSTSSRSRAQPPRLAALARRLTPASPLAPRHSSRLKKKPKPR